MSKINDYQKRCYDIAKLFIEAGDTDQPIEHKLSEAVGWVEKWPEPSDNINIYRIRPIPNELDKYIHNKLDMEFTSHAVFKTDSTKAIGKLTSIQKEKCMITYTLNTTNSYYHCRLRPNHVHFWNRFAKNPIPIDCEFRVCNRSLEWSNWRHHTARSNYVFNGPAEKPIIAFEVRYPDED